MLATHAFLQQRECRNVARKCQHVHSCYVSTIKDGTLYSRYQYPHTSRRRARRYVVIRSGSVHDVIKGVFQENAALT